MKAGILLITSLTLLAGVAHAIDFPGAELQKSCSEVDVWRKVCPVASSQQIEKDLQDFRKIRGSFEAKFKQNQDDTIGNDQVVVQRIQKEISNPLNSPQSAALLQDAYRFLRIEAATRRVQSATHNIPRFTAVFDDYDKALTELHGLAEQYENATSQTTNQEMLKDYRAKIQEKYSSTMALGTSDPSILPTFADWNGWNQQSALLAHIQSSIDPDQCLGTDFDPYTHVDATIFLLAHQVGQTRIPLRVRCNKGGHQQAIYDARRHVLTITKHYYNPPRSSFIEPQWDYPTSSQINQAIGMELFDH